MADLLAAGIWLNAPAGSDATAASPAGTGGHRQEHEHGLDNVDALCAELDWARLGHDLAVAEAEQGWQLAALVEHIDDVRGPQQLMRPSHAPGLHYMGAIPCIHPAVPGSSCAARRRQVNTHVFRLVSSMPHARRNAR